MQIQHFRKKYFFDMCLYDIIMENYETVNGVCVYMAIKMSPFGMTREGKNVTLYQLINDNGMQADIIDYGASLVNLYVPDNKGKKKDVVLGFDDVAGYEDNSPFLGVVVGRNCNRIKGGKFEIGGRVYQMAQNDGGNNLHSGPDGYHLRLWDASASEGDYGCCLKLSLKSADGDQGFPGRLYVNATYVLTNEGCLHLTLNGISNKDTIVNMTSHSYFNLNGHSSGSIEGHQLWINAESYVPISDNSLLPSGEIRAVEGTAFDFREKKAIGEDIGKEDSDLLLADGYDHNMVLSHPDKFRCVAILEGENSGIAMEVFTDQPGLQLYTGNSLDGTKRGKESVYYQKRGGVCLETQTFPDAPNNSNFPSSIVKAGEMYLARTTYKFTAG